MNRRLIPVDDVTIDELLKAHQEFLATKPLICRVASGLINLGTGEYQEAEYVQYKGNTYLYRYWPGKEDEAEIYLEVIDRVGVCTRCGQTNEYQNSAYTCWKCKNGQ
jgi:hypothetical protein